MSPAGLAAFAASAERTAGHLRRMHAGEDALAFFAAHGRDVPR